MPQHRFQTWSCPMHLHSLLGGYAFGRLTGLEAFSPLPGMNCQGTVAKGVYASLQNEYDVAAARGVFFLVTPCSAMDYPFPTQFWRV